MDLSQKCRFWLLGFLNKRPGNVYSMTKQANERLAAVCCNVTGMRHVGLRSFTVYGA